MFANTSREGLEKMLVDTAKKLKAFDKARAGML